VALVAFPVGEPVQRRPEPLASEDVLLDHQLVGRLGGIGHTDGYVAPRRREFSGDVISR
jgi:hypothetical protein